MTIDAMIMLVGGLVAILPFLGFPNSWDNIIFFVLGMFVVALGVVVRRRKPSVVKRPVRKTRAAYVENEPPAPAEPALTHDELAQ